jgi:cell division protein FtsB
MSVGGALRAITSVDLEAPNAPATRERHLVAVPAMRWRAPRAPFLIVVGGLLGGGLLALLALNTTLAEGSFAVYDLKRETAALADQEQALVQEVALAESPEQLEKAARRQGMVAAANPVFLRLADGAVLGVPVAAEAPKAPARKAAAAKTAAAKPAVSTPAPAPKPASKPATSGLPGGDR